MGGRSPGPWREAVMRNPPHSPPSDKMRHPRNPFEKARKSACVCT